MHGSSFCLGAIISLRYVSNFFRAANDLDKFESLPFKPSDSSNCDVVVATPTIVMDLDFSKDSLSSPSAFVISNVHSICPRAGLSKVRPVAQMQPLVKFHPVLSLYDRIYNKILLLFA